jgi:uncharacterized protein YdeI (YjbR/CyaY-like superfamily)
MKTRAASRRDEKRAPAKRTPARKRADPGVRDLSLRFSGPGPWDEWLSANYARVPGVWLEIGKKGSVPSISYAEALDVALAWGWIDSRKETLDETRWRQRFTPRKRRGGWSRINRGKAQALIDAGRMRAPGVAEVERAKADGRWEAAYDSAKTSTVPADFSAALRRNARAKAFFETIDAANRYAILHRLQTARKPETRTRRIETFVAMLANGKTIHPARRKA